MSKIRNLVLASAVSGAMASPVIAGEPQSIREALTNGDVKLSLRLRYEDVSTDNIGAPDGESDLLSLKTRLTYTSQDFQGFGLGLEFDDVTHVTDLEPRGSGAAIGDPEGTEVNQYFLSYKFGKSVAKYGRQRILLDNQRHVGGVGFRQNEQTYDAITILSKDVEKLTLFGAYVTNVNRIFGEQDPRGDNNSETLLLNAKYSYAPSLNLTGYYYSIDNKDVARFSTDTFGLRATGAISDFGYTAEFATQSDGGDNTASYSATYLNLEGSYNIKPVKLTVGHEVLGADGSDGQFITPLATLHKFQGWADQFLGGGSGNIPGGIADTYFTAAGKAGPVKLVLSYHILSADDSDVTGTDDYGDEIGFVVAGKVSNVALSLKYAAFSAESGTSFTDTDKLWLTAATSF